MSLQNRLFTYTRNGDLLTGSEVIKANRTTRIIRQLQRDTQMVEDWRLDIFCREPTIISDIIVASIDPPSALGSRWKFGICIVNTPTSTCISPYTLTVAWFGSKDDAEVMLETIRAYMALRYAV